MFNGVLPKNYISTMKPAGYISVVLLPSEKSVEFSLLGHRNTHKDILMNVSNLGHIFRMNTDIVESVMITQGWLVVVSVQVFCKWVRAG